MSDTSWSLFRFQALLRPASHVDVRFALLIIYLWSNDVHIVENKLCDCYRTYLPWWLPNSEEGAPGLGLHSHCSAEK